MPLLSCLMSVAVLQTASGLPVLEPGVNPWVLAQPGGGGAFDAIGAGPDGLILAATDLNGAYLSRDGGRTWTNVGSRQGLTVTHVCDVGFDPTDPNLLYLATEEGLFRSDDAGRRFIPVHDSGFVTEVTFAPNDPFVGYLAHHSAWDVADGTIWRSDDRGRSWRRISGPSLPGGRLVLEILVSALDSDVVFVVTGEGRFSCGPAELWESRNGGRHWRRIAAGLGQICDIALDPTDPDALFVTTYGDVWDPGYDCVQDDPGGGWLHHGTYNGSWSWTRLTHPSDLGSRNLLVFPDRDDAHALRVFDLDTAAEFVSLDGGTTWTFVGDRWSRPDGWTRSGGGYGTSFEGDLKTIGEDLSDPDALLWCDSQFLYASRDDGLHWAPIHTHRTRSGGWRTNGADNVVPFDLAVDADGVHVYLAAPDLGCFRSEDHGWSWRPANDPRFTGSWGENGGNCMTIVTDPTRPGVVWVSQANEIEGSRHSFLRSDDFGATWRRSDTGLPILGIPSGASVDPTSPQAMRRMFLTWDGDVYRSDDDGFTWARVLASGGLHFTAVDPRDGTVFAGGEDGLWRSSSHGDPGSWQEVGLPSMRGNLGHVFWDSWWEGTSSIHPDPARAGWVWVAVHGRNGGIHLSRDHGSTWQRITDDSFAWDVAVLPDDPDVVFSASSSALYSGGYDPASKGLQVSRDGGTTWAPFDDGLAWPFARRILVQDTPQGATLWLASPGTGYLRRDLGPGGLEVPPPTPAR